MPVIHSRLLFLCTFLLVAGLVSFALYLQYVQNIAPCPLCMLQRIAFILIGLVALAAVMHNPMVKGLRNYGIIVTFFASIGLALAGRHVWLESLPPNEAPACGPSLEVMLDYLPLFEVLKTTIMGTGDCAKVIWSFLGLSVADWSLVCFAGLFLVGAAIVIKPVGRF